jgi:hypothetical protein
MPPANHQLSYRPLRGGIIVSNPLCGVPGTLGCIGTTDGDDRWIISCYHVLVRTSFSAAFDDGETIDQPDGNPVAKLAQDRTHKVLDCAAALIDVGIGGLPEILSVGTVEDLITAKEGMILLKSGISTGITEGRIRKVQGDGTIQIARIHPQAELSEKGDSGALWVERETGAAVGLHTGMDNRGFACASPIGEVLLKLNLRLLLPAPRDQ